MGLSPRGCRPHSFGGSSEVAVLPMASRMRNAVRLAQLSKSTFSLPRVLERQAELSADALTGVVL